MRRIAGDVVTRGEDSSTQLGFTVVEMLVSLILFTITLWLGSSVFSGYVDFNLERPRGLGAVQSLDLALLVEGENHGVVNGLRRSSRWT